MAIPIVYNLRSVRARWVSAIVAVLGIAGTVGVFIAMLSLARGFKATLVASGSPDNALIRRAGSTGEIDGSVILVVMLVGDDARAHGVDQPGAAMQNAEDRLCAFPQFDALSVAMFPVGANSSEAPDRRHSCRRAVGSFGRGQG